MLTDLIRACSTYLPPVRRGIWRKAYNALNNYFMDNDWYFLNYGFVPEDNAKRLYLQPTDEADRLFIQLYEAILGDLSIEGKDLLEVGSGRGGGSSYIARYRKPNKIVGADRSEKAVSFCRKHHQVANLSYEVGDAEALAFPSDRFDVVLNVESSHCYRSMRRFAVEVERVLKPGGTFAWGDFRNKQDLPEVERAFASTSLQPVAWTDITTQVVQALDEMNERKVRAIQENAPKFFVPALNEFAAVKGAGIYREFVERKKIYIAARFQKPRT